jgi:hypothetical protein
MGHDGSYELFFWRQESMMTLSSRAIYESLRDGRPVDGLALLAIDELLAAVVASFPGARFEPEDPVRVVWRAPNGEDGFEVAWSAQHLAVDCWHLGEVALTAFVDLAARYGCPLYDPQSGQRSRLRAP